MLILKKVSRLGVQSTRSNGLLYGEGYGPPHIVNNHETEESEVEMSKSAKLRIKSMMAAAFHFVYNDSLELETIERPKFAKLIRHSLLKKAISISRSNNVPLIRPTEEEINETIHGIWTHFVDLLRNEKMAYGQSASAKKKVQAWLKKEDLL
jgi:hypothetical protein